MKKSVIMVLVMLLYSISIAGYAQAQESKAWPPFVKLGRGISNIVTSPLEIPKNIGDANKTDGMFAAFTWGVFQGLADFAGRAVVGVYEMVTFPIPLPGDYAPILKDPEYFLQDFHH